MARPIQFGLSTLFWAIAATACGVAFAKFAPEPAFVVLAIATLPVSYYLAERIAEHCEWRSQQSAEDERGDGSR
ncbi:MAG TPA: hypothetical protein VGX78_05455 [Pirellulales bacterium]|jgi:hypothetical protein|nr:hypothetical protein [Pirellulales bacterium]